MFRHFALSFGTLQPHQKIRLNGTREEVVIAVAGGSVLCASGNKYSDCDFSGAIEVLETLDAGSYPITASALSELKESLADGGEGMLHIEIPQVM